ncbi:hypothetical protein QBC43DRAFT_285946 [Cladorrhinum sp. PSN259]|nr:hypothetical protein QBC43DRAFT_285946 [Cladorrhinum sp. PSN259]
MSLRDITLAMFRCRASDVFNQKDGIYGLYNLARQHVHLTSSRSSTKLILAWGHQAGSLISHHLFALATCGILREPEERATPVSSTPQFSFDSDGETLRCDAIFIDRVKWKTDSTIWKPRVADPVVRYQDSDLANLENSEHAAQTILAFLHYGTPEDCWLALGNVLTVGHLQKFKVITLETPLVTVSSWVSILMDANYRNEIFDGISQDPGESPQARDFICELSEQEERNEPDALRMLCVLKHFPIIARFTHAVWMHNEDKVLFVTEGGLLGSTNMSLKEGDAVFRLLNVDKPMVLRQVDDKWTVDGPAYVEGIMKGERWREGVAEEIWIV